MSNYSAEDSMVKVTLWKQISLGHLDWKCDAEMHWDDWDGDMFMVFKRSFVKQFGTTKFRGLIAICDEPYHKHSYPVSILIPSDGAPFSWWKE